MAPSSGQVENTPQGGHQTHQEATAQPRRELGHVGRTGALDKLWR